MAAGTQALDNPPGGKVFIISPYVVQGEPVEFEFKGPAYARIKWNFGDGKTDVGGRRISHIYQQPGFYEVGAGDAAQTTSAPVSEKVRVSPDQRALKMGRSEIAAGAEITAQALYFFAPSIRWNFGDNSPEKNGPHEITHIYSQPGLYTLRAIDFGGASLKPAETTLRVVPDSRVLIPPDKILAGEPAAFSIQNASTGQFSWEFPGHERRSGVQPDPVTFRSPGSATITIKDASGFYGPKHIQVSVSPDNRRIVADKTEMTITDEITLTAENIMGKTVKWVLGDGRTEENAPPSIRRRFEKPGSYRISVFDLNGRSPVAFTANITVGELSRDFQIKKLEFAFANGKSGVVAPKGAPMTPFRLRLQAEGRGMLRGRWILDGKTLGLFRMSPAHREFCEPLPGQYPELPAIDPGLHRLSCEFLNHTPPFDMPVLSYFVAETGFLSIISPAPDSTLPPADSVSIQWELNPWQKHSHRAISPGEHFEVAVSAIPFPFLPDGKTIWISTGADTRCSWPSAGVTGWVYWQARLVRADGTVITTSETGAFHIRESGNER